MKYKVTLELAKTGSSYYLKGKQKQAEEDHILQHSIDLTLPFLLSQRFPSSQIILNHQSLTRYA